LEFFAFAPPGPDRAFQVCGKISRTIKRLDSGSVLQARHVLLEFILDLQGFGAVPPLVTDIDLSMDDRFLYVSCWGTGEMCQYDVTDPRKPKLAGSVHIGGIARRTAHPSGKPYAGGPQMVEISRDGRRVYWTNSLYSTWDNQFYPDGILGAEVMANANPNGGLELAKDYCVSFPAGYRAHQIRLEGGDCSTDSFCYPSV
jgi:methanethiol oxidase